MYTAKSKVSIIGAGFVGSTTAYTLMLNGLVSELVIVDVNIEKSLGEVMDLNHGISFVSPLKISAGNYEDTFESDIVIITAGANQKPGESRLDLVKKNTEIFKSIIPQIVKYSPKAILLVVANPVDILTYVAYKLSGLPKNRIIGSGTVLDTSRFRYLLSEHTNIDVRNIHAYILGEHGDSEVPIWSKTNIAGMSMNEFCEHCKECSGMQKDEILSSVKSAAYEIIRRKGATYYAVALAVSRIVECILRDQRSILTTSSIVAGEYGLNNVCISLPCIVSNRGIEKILEINLEAVELQLLHQSSKVLVEIINELKI